MNRHSSPFAALSLSLPLALATPAAVHGREISAPNPNVDWQVGVIALVGIGIVGGGTMLAGNARRRRETRAAEQITREGAARAQAAITGGEAEDDLHRMAKDIEEMSEGPPDAANPFHARKARPRRGREFVAERDQNTPGTSLQRTRSQ
jgi:hypothetical protein